MEKVRNVSREELPFYRVGRRGVGAVRGVASMAE
jgi:hypothetical protein